MAVLSHVQHSAMARGCWRLAIVVDHKEHLAKVQTARMQWGSLTQSLSISSLVGDLASPVLDDILHEREVENWMCSINAVDS